MHTGIRAAPRECGSQRLSSVDIVREELHLLSSA